MSQQLPSCLKKFDSTLFRFSIDHNEGSWKMPFEWHDALEIFYVLEGRGQYFIENRFYNFETGSLFVISNNELHKSQIRQGEHFKAVVIMFKPTLVSYMQIDDDMDPLSVFFDRPPDFCHQLDTDLSLRERLERGFLAMKEEYEREQGYSMRVIASILQWLLVEINRAYEKNADQKWLPSTKTHMKEIISQSIEYVESHYTEEINLSKVAEVVGVSPTYLSSEFKKNTGISFVDFISVKRIQTAKDYLQSTDWSITDISFRVGYKNVTHFNYVFKKFVGNSPSQYRKMAANV